MSKAAAAFAAGLLGGGLKGYAMRKEWDRNAEKDKRAQEAHDLQVDAERRRAENARAADAAANEYADMVDTGKVNVLPPGMDNQTMGPPTSMAPEAAGGATSAVLSQLHRPATPVDKLGALTKVAAAKGDVNTMAALGKQTDEARHAKDDLDYGMRLAQDPAGKEAQELLGLLGKQSIGGVSLRTDPQTGLSFVDVSTPGGEPRTVELSGSNMAKLAIARRKLERGDPSALADIAEIDKGLSAAMVAQWKFQQEVGKLNNDAVSRGANIAHQAITSGLAMNADSRAERGQEHTIAEAQRKASDEAAQRESGAKLAQAAGWTPEQVEAVRTGAIKPPSMTMDGSQPAEVKLAHAYIQAGLAKDLAQGLQMATQSKDYSPDRVRTDIYGKALAASFGDAKRAQDATELAMSYLFPAPAANAPGAPGARPAAAPPVGQIINGYQFKGGNPRDRRNWAPAASGRVE